MERAQASGVAGSAQQRQGRSLARDSDGATVASACGVTGAVGMGPVRTRCPQSWDDESGGEHIGR